MKAHLNKIAQYTAIVLISSIPVQMNLVATETDNNQIEVVVDDADSRIAGESEFSSL